MGPETVAGAQQKLTAVVAALLLENRYFVSFSTRVTCIHDAPGTYFIPDIWYKKEHVNINF